MIVPAYIGSMTAGYTISTQKKIQSVLQKQPYDHENHEHEPGCQRQHRENHRNLQKYGSQEGFTSWNEPQKQQANVYHTHHQ